MVRILCMAGFLMALALGGPSSARSLDDTTGPKELPPADFVGTQFVDSEGCVFVRAGFGGQVRWVPRVSPDRKVVCGYRPTFAQGASDGIGTQAAAPAVAPPAAPLAEPPAVAPAAPAAMAATASASPVATAAPRVKSPSARSRPAAPARVLVVSAGPIPGGWPDCPGPAARAQRYVLSDGRRIVRCGDPVEDVVGWINGLNRPGLHVDGMRPSYEKRIPAGYRSVLPHGRSAADSLAGQAAPSAAGAGGFVVQVGAFGEDGNAGRARARIGELGLASYAEPQNGLSAVLAGPFASRAEASAALLRLRRAGYPSAFLRRSR